MKILLLSDGYPHAAHPFAGLFSERNVAMLRGLCEEVGVLVPRPLVPPILASLVPRWRIYAQIPPLERRGGLLIRRPGYPQLPRLAAGFWFEVAGYYFIRHVAREMHQVIGFDAILVLDLVAGGLGWRLGDELGIPTFGWAFGGDVRVTPSSFRARALRRTLERLDVVFYQSRELMGKAAALMQITPDQMLRERHVVLPHGIPRPPVAGCDETRKRVREAWKISDDQIVVLSVGRITREKGIYEILEAISRAAARDPKVTGVVVGSMPAFDETAAVQDLLKRAPELGRHVRLYPACEPDQVWEYLCAADIFAFASRREGMPNSLLEAMAMGVPAVAFAIPAIEDLDAGQSSLLTVPLGDVKSFAEAILGLAASPEKRASLGKRGLARVMDGFMVEKNMRIALEHMAKVLERRQSTKRGGTSSALPPS